MKKLLFFDIDGTLAMPGHPPGDLTCEAIRSARAAGHGGFLSTGRSAGFIDPAIRAIGFDGGIYHAGARVRWGNRFLLDQPMEEERVRQLLSILLPRVLHLNLEAARWSYAEGDPFPVSEAGGESTEMQRIKLQNQILKVLPLADYDGEPVYKISFFLRPEADGAALGALLPDWSKLVFFENLIPGLSFVAGEVSDRRFTKATAMAELCRKAGLDLTDCVAFGDSMNDAEMLEAAGLGIAMGNAPEAVKALADLVCDPCAEDGVGKALVRLGLA